MVTKVGLQDDLFAAVVDLIELDYDAVEAYEAAIDRVDNETYRSKLESFKGDHERHIQELTAFLAKHNRQAPKGPSAKQWLTKGKVVLANLVGDETILRAMRSNEIDTNSAYEHMCARDDILDDLQDILRRGFEDEKRHKAWLENTIHQSQTRKAS